MKPSHRRALTLGIHPTSRGFGWIVFEGPLAPYDWESFTAKGSPERKNQQCLRQVELLIRRFRPQCIVLESLETANAKRSDRIHDLCKGILVLATNEGVETAIHARRDVQACFTETGALTRDEIADVVARHVPALRPYLPARRRRWDGEDRRTAIFTAAALVLTHYAYDMTQLFEDLKGEA